MNRPMLLISMGTFDYLLKKELLILQRDKPALMYALLMPIILLVLVISLYAITFTSTVTVIDQDGGKYAKDLIAALKENPSIKLVENGDESLLRVAIPAGFSRAITDTGLADLRIEYDNTRRPQVDIGLFEMRKAVFSFYVRVYKERGQLLPSAVASSDVLKFLITPVLEERARPDRIMTAIMETLKVKENPVFTIRGKEIALLPYTLPIIIASIMTLFALVLAPYSIIHERKVGLYERLSTLPIRRREMVLSKILLVTAVVFFQAILMFLILTSYYGFFVGGAMTILGAGLIGFANASLAILISIASRTILQTLQLIGVTLVLQIMLATGADPATIGGWGGTLLSSLPLTQGWLFLQHSMLKDTIPLGPLLYLALFGTAAIAIATVLLLKIRPSR